MGHCPPPREPASAYCNRALSNYEETLNAPASNQTQIALLGQIQRQWQTAVMEPLHPKGPLMSQILACFAGKRRVHRQGEANGSAFAEF
jgi:hypothetical protein